MSELCLYLMDTIHPGKLMQRGWYSCPPDEAAAIAAGVGSRQGLGTAFQSIPDLEIQSRHV